MSRDYTNGIELSRGWKARAICCGFEESEHTFATWEEADAFRESYTSGPAVHPHGFSAGAHEPGHKRAVIVSAAPSLEALR